MGGNKMNAQGMKANTADKKALQDYSAATDEDLKTLWNAFDKDNSGEIDQEELREIVFHLIAIFWEYATPHKKIPKRDQLSTVIDHICEQIMLKAGKTTNPEDVMTRAEFKAFGDYVLQQWHATEEKCEKDGVKAKQKMSTVNSLRG